MAEKSSSKSIEYVENDFSTLNAHVDGILYNEKQVSRLKKYRVDRVRIKQFGLIVLIVGILAILLAIAYHFLKKPVAPEVHTIVKTEFVIKPVYELVEVPVPGLSIEKEVPIYIDREVRVPIQVGAVTDEFTFFHTEEVNDLEGILFVTRGASYESVNSSYPEEQWCYAGGKSKTDNTQNRINLSNKSGTNPPKSVAFTEKDAKEFGSTVSALNKAINYCKWHPDSPPIDDDNSTSPIITDPIEPVPDMPPGTFGYGTGFYINSNGYLLTNQHVIDTNNENSVYDKCSSVRVIDDNVQNVAKVVKHDIDLDIAVLKINKITKNYAKFGYVRTGAEVRALGYPLMDTLGHEISVTQGIVNSLSGFKGDKNELRYSAQTHSGNSGGPLLNEGGFVVGIVKRGLTGEKFSDLNFAVKGSAAQKFLGQNNSVYFDSAIETIDILKWEDIIENSKKFTVIVACYP
jgi:S1-C subfamily serine protease